MPIKVHLSKLMGERKIKALELSRQTGINKNTILGLYHETKKGIQFETLEKLCKFFNCNVGDLIEYLSPNKYK